MGVLGFNGSTSMIWIIWALVWVVCGVLCATVAKSKNRGAGDWFVIGLLTGVFGLIAIVGMAPRPKEPIREQLRVAPSVEPRLEQLEPLPPGRAAAAFLCTALVLGVIILLAYMSFP
jgi:hypothetical protein